MTQKLIDFYGEEYSYEEYEDGSKRLHTKKNKKGFSINIKVSGDPEELKEGIQALKDFYAAISL